MRIYVKERYQPYIQRRETKKKGSLFLRRKISGINQGKDFENAGASLTCAGNNRELEREMEDIPENKMRIRELPYKTAQDLLRIGRFKPTFDQNQVIQNIFNDIRI